MIATFTIFVLCTLYVLFFSVSLLLVFFFFFFCRINSSLLNFASSTQKDQVHQQRTERDADQHCIFTSMILYHTLTSSIENALF